MPLVPPLILRPRPRRRKRNRSNENAPPAPPPPAVALVAVYEQQNASTLLFVFDSELLDVDVSGTQFQCTVAGTAVFGVFVESWDAGGIIVEFGEIVNTATVAALNDGGGLTFANGGVAAGGQSVSVTPPPP